MKREQKRLNYIDFKVEREDWNVYKLEDGTILKLKFILLKVIREKIDKEGRPIYSVQSSIVSTVFPPSNLLGMPDTRRYSIKELETAVIKPDMKFEALKEDYSSKYILKETVGELRLEVKPVLIAVARTKKYDERGEPIYLIRHTSILKTSPYPLPKHIREQFLKMRE